MSIISNIKTNFPKVAGKIAGNKLLLTLRDSFVLASGVTMIAGFAVMLNSVFLDPAGIIFGKSGLHIGKLIAGSWESWETSGFADGLRFLQSMFGLISQGTLSTLSVLLVIVFSYNLSKKYFPKNKEHMISVLFSMAAFFICLPWKFSYDQGTSKIIVEGFTNSNFFGTQGVFSALLISGLATVLYNKLLQKNISIKLPDSVPPAVSRSFESLVPGTITLSVFIVLVTIVNKLSGLSIPEFLLAILQKPAMAMSGTSFFAFFSQFTWSLLQWFGIHPTSIWGPIYGITWNVSDTENMLGTARHLYSTLMLNFSTIAAGTCSVAPVVAILIASKKKSDKTISKVALMPAIFNISEPIVFGLPIVLNPYYFVPFVLVQPISFYIGVFFIKIGFIDVITNSVPWTVPPLLSGLLFTGSFKGVIVQLVILTVATLIYIPFVKMANQQKEVTY